MFLQSSVTHTPIQTVNFTDFISLSEAVTLVTYSRDYIGRLAREGKICAKQTDKQWVVSRASLVNFFEQSSLEDSVKKRILSLSRKNDLEVKDFYRAAVATISNRQTRSGNASLFFVTLIIFGGLFSGVALHSNASLLSRESEVSLVQLLSSLTLLPNTANVIQPLVPESAVFFEASVVETQDRIPMEGGIVLFPTVTAADGETVETLFSDDVTVVVTSTTTGFVRSADGATELPFVRVPKETTP